MIAARVGLGLVALVAILTVPTAAAGVPELVASPEREPVMRVSLTPLTPPAGVAAGDVIAASVRLENSGTRPLHGLRVRGAVCPVTRLGPGQRLLCSASRRVTRADVDAGSATVQVHAQDGEGHGADATMTVPALPSPVPAPGLRLTVAGHPHDAWGLGDVVPLEVHLANPGPPLRDLTLADPYEGAGRVGCSAGELDPGGPVTCRFAHVITQEDVDRSDATGDLALSVVASGTQQGRQVVSRRATLRLPLAPTARMVVRAVPVSGPGPVTPGDRITVQVRVRNRGDVSLSGLSVAGNEPDDPPLACDLDVVTSGDVAHCEGVVVVTGADGVAGRVARHYAVASRTPSGARLRAAPPTLRVPVVPSGLDLGRVDAGPGAARVGDRVRTTYTVVNRTGAPVRDLAVITAPARAEGAVCHDTELGPGASTTCEGVVSLTRHDIDAAARAGGRLRLWASAQARSPAGPLGSPQSVTDLGTDTSASLIADLTAGGAGPVTVGDDLQVALRLHNIGAVTVTDIRPEAAGVTGLACPGSRLKPGAEMTCRAERWVTPLDIARGSIEIGASATASPVSAAPTRYLTVVAAPLTVPTSALTALALTTTVEPVSDGLPAAPGALVRLVYRVRALGPTTVSGLRVHDPRFLPGQIGCPVATLAPGETTRCVGLTVITPADADSADSADSDTGRVIDLAVAAGVVDGAPVASEAARAVLPITTRGRIGVRPLPTPAPPGLWTPGTARTVGFVVRNTGTVTAQSLRGRLGTAPSAPPLLCPHTTVAAGASVVCTVRIGVRGARRPVVVTARTVTGARLAARTPQTASGAGDVAERATLEIRDAAARAQRPVRLGDPVDVGFRVTNTGSGRVNRLQPAGGLLDPSSASCSPSVLVPGETALCHGTHAVTAGDLDRAALGAGRLTAAVGAQGVDGRQRTVAAEPADVAVDADVEPGLSVVVRPVGSVGMVPGDLAVYRVIVANEGGQSVQSIALSSPQVSGVSCPLQTLEPGRFMACRAVHPVGAAEGRPTEAGFAASGTGVDGSPVTSAESVAALPDAVTQGLRVQLAHRSGRVAAVGDVRRLELRITATGDQLVRDVVLSGDHRLSSCDIGDLEPGETVRCPATLILTQEDVDGAAPTGPAAGRALIGVRATGVHGDGAPVTSATRWVRVPVRSRAAVTVHQTLARSDSAAPAAQDVVPVSLRVTNTGGPTLTGVALSTPALQGLTCPATPDASPDRLPSRASLACTAERVVSQDDVQAGSFDSAVSVEAYTGDGRSVAAASDVLSVAASGRVGLSARLSLAAPTTPAKVGDRITSTLGVSNVGDKRVTALSFTDPLHTAAEAFTCDHTFLDPGEDTSCLATHVVTQADVDTAARVGRSSVAVLSESVTVAARTGAVAVTTRPARAELALDATTKLTASVRAERLADPVAAGDRVPVAIDLFNAGQQSLTHLRVQATGLERVTCDAPELAAGEHTACTGERHVRQVDVERGSIDESVTATATAADGSAVPALAALRISTSVRAGLALEGGPTSSVGRRRVGDVVELAYTVVNQGDLRASTVHVDAGRQGLRVTCDRTELDPGARTDCHGGYAVSQSDVDRGGVDLGVRALAGTRVGAVASAAQLLRLPTADSLGLRLSAVPVTTADATTPADRVVGDPVVAGDVVRYIVAMANTGDLSLTGLRIDGPGPGEVNCPRRTLAAGEAMSCRAAHLVAQSEVDAGSVQLAWTARGRTVDAAGSPRRTVQSPPDASALPASLRRDLDASRRLVPLTDGPVGAGDPVELVYDLVNTGDVTLSGLTIRSSLAGGEPALDCGPVLGGAARPSPLGSGRVPTLPPGAPVRCSVVVTVSQRQVDAGQVADLSEVTDPASGPGVRPVLHRVLPRASLRTAARVGLSATLDVAGMRDVGGAGLSAGDRLDMEISLANTGDRSLRLGEVVGSAATGARCPVRRLAASATTTCSAVVTVTRVPIRLVASVDATARGDAGAVSARTPELLVDRSPGVLVSRRVVALEDRAGDGAGAGDVARLEYRVINASAAPLRLTALEDSGPAPDCPPDRVIPPGGSMRCTGRHEITTDEAAHGQLAGEVTAVLSGVLSDATSSGADDVRVNAKAAVLPLPGNRDAPRFAVDDRSPSPDGGGWRWWAVGLGALALVLAAAGATRRLRSSRAEGSEGEQHLGG